MSWVKDMTFRRNTGRPTISKRREKPKDRDLQVFDGAHTETWEQATSLSQVSVHSSRLLALTTRSVGEPELMLQLTLYLRGSCARSLVLV